MKNCGILMLILLLLITILAVDLKAADASGFKFSEDQKTLIHCPRDIVTAVIPPGVTTIGNGAFANCEHLEQVTIPDSVTSIEDMAFYACLKLNNVKIPNSVTTIGRGAFADCWRLTKVTIPNSVTSIGDVAFAKCPLKQVVIGPQTRYYHKSTFPNNCKVFIRKTVSSENTDKAPESKINEGHKAAPQTASAEVTPPGHSALDAAKKAGIKFSEDNKTLLRCPNDIVTVVIPPGVTAIGRRAFEQCISLKHVTIPDSVTSIGQGAFRRCRNLTGIKIPHRVTDIGSSMFYGCEKLTSVTIPDGVTAIGGLAFYGCVQLSDLTIPDSVSSIAEGALFAVLSVKISPGNRYFKNGPVGEVINTQNNSLFYFPASFTGAYRVPDSVTAIGNGAFFDCFLHRVIISNSVTSIGEYAFLDCKNLNRVHIPNSVTTIGKSAFSGSALTKVYIGPQTKYHESSFPKNCKVIRRRAVSSGNK